MCLFFLYPIKLDMENKTTPFFDNELKIQLLSALVYPTTGTVIYPLHSFFLSFFPYLIELALSKDNKPQSRMEAFFCSS